MAGLMEWPRSLVHGYFRLVGLVFLIVYGLWMRLWDSIKPSLSPVLNIYNTIDSEEVNVPTIVQQFVKFVLMVGVLYWKTAQAIWDTVSRPFRKQVDDVARFLEDIHKEYKEKQQID